MIIKNTGYDSLFFFFFYTFLHFFAFLVESLEDVFARVVVGASEEVEVVEVVVQLVKLPPLLPPGLLRHDLPVRAPELLGEVGAPAGVGFPGGGLPKL